MAANFASTSPTEWGLDVTGVATRLPTDNIAITLDACGGPGGSGYDQQLIEGLITRQIPATLFLNSRWIEANPEVTAKLAANPLFELASHGTSHQPLSVTGQSAYGIGGTSSAAEAVQEVWGNHVLLTELTGSEPRFFRSGTAHYDDVAVRIVGALGEAVVGFTVNADAGATYPAGTIRQVVGEAEAGSILIAHMNQPDGETAEGLLAGVDDLIAEGHTFGFLGDLRN